MQCQSFRGLFGAIAVKGAGSREQGSREQGAGGVGDKESIEEEYRIQNW
jgi:hypothetical protein